MCKKNQILRRHLSSDFEDIYAQVSHNFYSNVPTTNYFFFSNFKRFESFDQQKSYMTFLVKMFTCSSNTILVSVLKHLPEI